MSSVYLEHRDAVHVPGASSRAEIARALDRVAEALLNSDAWMVTAGAGMGVDSGMPDFRGPTGLFHDRETPITWEETSNDKWFAEDPQFAWGMFYSRLDMYRTTTPHAGFDVLLKWATELGKPYHIFTSNVDCQFQTAGFPDGKVITCHGDFACLQCVDRNCKGPNHPDDQLWSADCIPRGLGADGGIDGNYRFVDPTALDAPYFHCPRCDKLARPNVWMCKDKNFVIRKSSMEKHDQYTQWKNELQESKARVVVFECGGGMVIPSIRVESEDMVDYCGDGSLMVRINPKDTKVPVDKAVGLALGCREALELIDQRVQALRRGDRRRSASLAARGPAAAPKVGSKAKAGSLRAKQKVAPKVEPKAKDGPKAKVEAARRADEDTEMKMLHSKALEIFQHLDVKGDGWILRSDMARLFELLDADINADKLLQTLDRSDNGRVDYAAFLEWVMGDSNSTELVQALMSTK